MPDSRNRKAILRPRFRGRRFAGGSIPFDVLADLVGLEKLVAGVARRLFLEDNEGRQRVPSGFEASMGLRLAALEAGSAVAAIDFRTPEHQLNLGSEIDSPNIHRYGYAAGEAIVAAVGAAEAGEDAGSLNPGERAALGALARSLREDEAIEFPAPSIADYVRLTSESGLRLIEGANAVPSEDVLEMVRGRVRQVDHGRRVFTLESAVGERIEGDLRSSDYGALMEAFNQFWDQRSVAVRGVVRRGASGAKFSSISSVELLDPLDVAAQLEQLGALQDGWLDGEGRAPHTEGVTWLGERLDRSYLVHEAPAPYLYPTEDGGVQAEWPVGDHEITLEVDLATRKGLWHDLDMVTDQDEERELNLDDDAAWTWVVETLRTLSRGDG